MRKFTAAMIAVFVAAAVALFIFVVRPRRRAARRAATPWPATDAPVVSPSGALLWFPGRPGDGVGSPRPSRVPRGVRAASLGGVERPARLRSTRGVAPSSRPLRAVSAAPAAIAETMPPYTLGPVPNGLTRVPEPPVVEEPDEAEIVIPRYSGGQASVFEEPAPRNVSTASNVAVPAVQNPWDTAQWRFLVGLPVQTALDIIQQQFPSFPVAKRHVQAGPGMSGAVTLRYDNSAKVVGVVRD